MFSPAFRMTVRARIATLIINIKAGTRDRQMPGPNASKTSKVLTVIMYGTILLALAVTQLTTSYFWG